MVAESKRLLRTHVSEANTLLAKLYLLIVIQNPNEL